MWNSNHFERKKRPLNQFRRFYHLPWFPTQFSQNIFGSTIFMGIKHGNVEKGKKAQSLKLFRREFLWKMWVFHISEPKLTERLFRKQAHNNKEKIKENQRKFHTKINFQRSLANTKELKENLSVFMMNLCMWGERRL